MARHVSHLRGTHMTSNSNIRNSDKLFDLCEKQLLSIISEAATSMEKVTSSTANALSVSNELGKLINESAEIMPTETALCANLNDSFSDVVINMQFFDELSQRIEHIMKIVKLIKAESSREGFLSDPQDSEELFDNIKRIFSIRSEFEVMRGIFPEIDEVDVGKAVELF